MNNILLPLGLAFIMFAVGLGLRGFLLEVAVDLAELANTDLYRLLLGILARDIDELKIVTHELSSTLFWRGGGATR